MSSLFVDKPLEFEKLAGMLTKMSDNSDRWAQEILQEAYKRLPYLSNFEVNVVIDKIDEGKGFGFGSIILQPKSELPPGKNALKKVHVIVTIRNQMLDPFDVFLHGKSYHHLSEGKIRAALFRPDAFDVARKKPSESTFGNELLPPSMSGANSGMGIKLGSALLPQLHGRVLGEHVDRVKTAMGDSSILASYAGTNDGVQAAVLSAMQLEHSDPVKTAKALIDHIRPDVVQMRRLDNGNYMMKWAAAEMYAPQQQEVPPETANAMAGPAQSQELQQNGMVTASPTADVAQGMEEDLEVRAADSFGMWKVEDTMGNQLVGWVFPRVHTFDMRALPSVVFTNGSQYAMQAAVAGKMIGKATDLPKTPPQGYGAFYCTKDGSAKIFSPGKITGTFQDPQGQQQYILAMDDGQTANVAFSDVLKAPARVNEGQVMLPSNYGWMPLKAKTELVSDPSLFTKTAVRKWSATGEIIGDGDIFSFRGPAIAKLASSETQFVDRPQAEFLGTLLGMRADFVKTALDKASSGELIKLSRVRTITPLAVVHAEARAKVASEIAEAQIENPIRSYFLVKEASVLDDAMTADKILGLGFLNAENIATFVDMLPSLESASDKLAEMLVAVRVGMKEVPEAAVERMLKALGDVIQGLHTIRQKEIKFGS